MRGPIARLLRKARVSLGTDDSGRYPVQQIESDGVPRDAWVLLPYGMHANLPVDVMGVRAMVGGDIAEQSFWPNSLFVRPQLEPGEVTLFHPDPDTLTKVVLKANGDVEWTVTGPLFLITVPTVEMSDDLHVKGKLTVDGDSEFGGTMKNDGTSVDNTHIHVENDSGGPTDPPS